MAIQNRHIFLIVAALGFAVTLVVMVVALKQGEVMMRAGDRPLGPPPVANAVVDAGSDAGPEPISDR